MLYSSKLTILKRPISTILNKTAPFSTSAEFDVFTKIKDRQTVSPTMFKKDVDGQEEDKKTQVDSSLKRSPSKKVKMLAKEVLSLSLIEAADLCDLCQEALQGPSGISPVGMSPFPHPGGLFPQMMGGMGMMAPGGQMPQQQQQPVAPATPPAEEAPAEETPEEDETPIVQVVKVYAAKLVSYPPDKKVHCVKEVRTLTKASIKECKDLVEEAPVVLRKGMTEEEANDLKTKFEALGATIELIAS